MQADNKQLYFQNQFHDGLGWHLHWRHVLNCKRQARDVRNCKRQAREKGLVKGGGGGAPSDTKTLVGEQALSLGGGVEGQRLVWCAEVDVELGDIGSR